MTQLIPFDVNKGGNVPNLCLANVVKGYGISNKYGSAWMAWEHTQQHPDRNVPAGLDVPLYYSYTTTLSETQPDGTVKAVTANYGHINVRLKNGTVWSDGNIYQSIDDYTSKKLPKFVGWGESINDFKIIEGGDMQPPINEGDIKNAWAAVKKVEANANDIAYWTGDDHKYEWKALKEELETFAAQNLVLKGASPTPPASIELEKGKTYHVPN